MGIEAKELTTTKEVFDMVDSLDGRFIFRGLPDSRFRLQSTEYRFCESLLGRQRRIQEMRELDVKGSLKKFKSGLARIGLYPKEELSELEWLEYARHCGVPSPLIDFTFSPYIALYFAFEIMGKQKVENNLRVSLLCLNYRELIKYWLSHESSAEERQHWSDRNPQQQEEKIDHFCNVQRKIPLNKSGLQFIPKPGVYTKRMIAQQGAFLVDLLDYGEEYSKYKDLEGYIDQIKTSNDVEEKKILIKIIMPYEELKNEMLSRLVKMNICGTSLFLDETGAVKDVFNATAWPPYTLDIRGC